MDENGRNRQPREIPQAGRQGASQSDRKRPELEEFIEKLEKLDRLERDLTPEEKAIEALLARLIDDYDERIELPDVPPAELIAYLMEHRGIRQADLLTIFGSSGIASEVLSGRRELSKAQIRKLAEFFRISPAAFL